MGASCMSQVAKSGVRGRIARSTLRAHLHNTRTMAHYLLIHGSWHGAWCWHKVVPRLEAAGHAVTAIDLPGRGRAKRAAPLVGLDTMVRACAAALRSDMPNRVLVHSRYGIVASALAERAWQRIERSIYLASFMLPAGKRVASYLPDADSLLTPHITVNKLGLWDWLSPTIYREGLYADCDPADVELARALLVREPVRPTLNRLKLTEDRYGCVPRAYIRLTQDQAVSLRLQDTLIERTGADRVESIAASHSAYFSQPQALVDTVLKVSG